MLNIPCDNMTIFINVNTFPIPFLYLYTPSHPKLFDICMIVLTLARLYRISRLSQHSSKYKVFISNYPKNIIPLLSFVFNQEVHNNERIFFTHMYTKPYHGEIPFQVP